MLPGKRAVKTSWHLYMVYLAFAELKSCSTNRRRFAVGAFGGWHLWATIYDFRNKRAQ